GLAHEMNTPIGNALTAASYLEAETGGIRGKLAQPAGFRRSDLTDYLSSVEEGARIVLAALQRAAGLVQLFKQAASEGGDAGRCRFSLKHLLADFAAAAAQGLAERGCVLMVECPDDVEMDSYPVALSNAAQHAYSAAVTPGEARGGIFVRVERRGPDECRLEVIDHGVGVAENDRMRVFEPFYTTGRNQGHTGLGLHVAFNLVIGPLGGHIAVEAADPRGTRVVVDFPRVSPS
ncbi:HAMP domain-containing histidine kinase, partial [bacterium]|nr:HAMP domain-containing histidine kinase [bacterium]